MLESYRNHALELQSYNKQKQLAEDSLEASNKATKELQARCQSLQELHQNEILEYKKKVKDLEEIINILKDTNENQSSRLLEQESQMNKLRQRLNEEKGVANSKNDKLEKLEQQYEKELLNKKNVITSLETKIRTIEEMMSSAQQELALSETRRREDEEKNSLMYKEISISLSTAEKSNRQLREQLNNLTSEKANAKEAFEERIEDLIQSNENYQLKTFELERKISSLETNSNINFQKFSKTEMDLQAKILNLMSSNDSLKSELSALKQAKDDLSDKAIDLENQLNLLTEEKDNLESEYAEKVSEYDSLSEEYHAVKMELNKEVKNLSAEVKDLKQANNALSADHKKHSDELHQEKIHMQSVIDKLTTDCESLNQTIESYREQINYNNNEIASLSLKISKQDKELTCKNLVINKNNELIKQLNEEIEAISTEKNHLQDQFADIQGASIVMKVKLSENENVINRQRNENKRLTDELMDRTEQLKASKTTIVDLQDDIDGLRLKKEELETELDSYKTFAETSSGKLKLSEKNVTYLEKELVVKLKQTIKHLEDKCQDSEVLNVFFYELLFSSNDFVPLIMLVFLTIGEVYCGY